MSSPRTDPCRNSLIMSSIELNRNVLFPQKRVEEEATEEGRCLSGRRTFRDESEGEVVVGDDVEGKG